MASSPRTSASGEPDTDHALWRWLVQRPSDAPPVQLAYGLQDRFVVGHALMAQTLPSHSVITAPGGHDWPPWRTLWAQWLDRGLLPLRCPA